MPRRSNKNNNNNKKRRKKPKFLSLRHLNLNLAADDETSAAADFFSAAVDNFSPTLSSLFSDHSLTCTGGDVAAAHDSTTQSPSLTCTGGNEEREREEEEDMVLVRTAMRRGREKEKEREEKWVCYEEVTSCCCVANYDYDNDDDANVHHRQEKSGPPMLLSLKLDYQEIMDAWCDKGPFYMPGPQIVPDLSLDFGLNDGWRSNGAMWTVPENTVGVKMEHELEEELKIRHREASVLRYKEKRQNRLFSKRIRYEVRKINAEKRPRMKGRFVKRN